jgi:hypothetical protein
MKLDKKRDTASSVHKSAIPQRDGIGTAMAAAPSFASWQTGRRTALYR